MNNLFYEINVHFVIQMEMVEIFLFLRNALSDIKSISYYQINIFTIGIVNLINQVF